MNSPEPDNLKRRLSGKEVLGAFCVVAYLLTAIVVSQAYSPLIGGLMFVAMLVAIPVAVSRLNKEQTKRIAAALEKQEATPFGQLMKIVNWAVVLMVAFVAIRWAYERVS